MDSMKKKNKPKFFKNRIISLAACALMLFSAVLPAVGCAKKTEHAGAVIISEVVASNKYAHTASDGSTPDIVELYNASGNDIDLVGCGLSDTAEEPHMFTFPDVVIPAGGYLTVYCTGTNDTESPDGVMRAGFKIGADGDLVLLSDPKGNALAILLTPAMDTDVSYGFDGEKYVYYKYPTVGQPNSGETNDTGVFEYEEEVVSATLAINEYIVGNEYSVMDADGERSSWAELVNTGSETVNLKDYCITDDETRPTKWAFPDREVAPGELAVVYLSGKDSVRENEIHAGFSLSEDDAVLMLTTAKGRNVDSMEVVSTGGMISVGRDGYYIISTPGEPNGKAYSSLEEAEKAIPDVYISEVKSTSEDKIDYVELHNMSDEDIDISGYGISDSRSDIYRYTFTDTVIPAGGYIVVEGRGGSGSRVGEFGIDKSGESVYLANGKGIIIDTVNSGWQSGDISRGRKAGESKLYFFTTSTKGKVNDAEAYSTYASDPVFSVMGGYVDNGTSVEIRAGEGETIYYTTDGSEPTKNSKQYSGAIAISATCTVRACAYAEGKLKSAVVTENFLVGDRHTLPVICVSMDPDDFLGDAKGIYAKGAGYYDHDGVSYTHQKANYWQDWEREMNFEFFEADGTKGVSFDAGIRIFGQYSRELPKKSFSVHLRGKYGINQVTYPFFEDNDVTTLSSFVIRQSGQDWGTTLIKDAFVYQSIKGEMSLPGQDYRPCVLYINGEYWGIYNIREKENEDYIVNHYADEGAVKGDIDLVKGDTHPQVGSHEDWMEVRQYIRSHVGDGGANNNIDTQDAVNWLNERVDMTSQMEWTIVEAFYFNSDTGNVRDFRVGDGKWRKMLFDVDHALKANGYNYINYLAEVMNDNGHGTGDMFQSHIFKAIKYNSVFRKQFIELYAHHINTTFDTDRLCGIIDEMAAQIRPEIERNCKRWGDPASADEWEASIEELKKTVANRRPYAIKEIKNLFGLSNDRMKELFPNDWE